MCTREIYVIYGKVHMRCCKNDRLGTKFLPIIIPWERNNLHSPGWLLQLMEEADPLFDDVSRKVPLFRTINTKGKKVWLTYYKLRGIAEVICTVSGHDAELHGTLRSDMAELRYLYLWD